MHSFYESMSNGIYAGDTGGLELVVIALVDEIGVGIAVVTVVGAGVLDPVVRVVEFDADWVLNTGTEVVG